MRQALAHGFDKERLTKTILGGHVTPAWQLLPPMSWAYNPKVAHPGFDPVRAQRLLEEAGWKAGPVVGGGRMEYVIAGETNLMGAGELSSVDKLRRLFEAFNEKRDILNLLDHSLRADGVQIFIGQESGYRILDDMQRGHGAVQRRQRSGRRDRRHRPDAHGLRARHSHRRYHREAAAPP